MLSSWLKLIIYLKMQSSVPNRILPGISCLAWNKDCSKIAICPTNMEIWIFKTNQTADISKWERIQILKEVKYSTMMTS
jgi:hypothetical protein